MPCRKNKIPSFGNWGGGALGRALGGALGGTISGFGLGSGGINGAVGCCEIMSFEKPIGPCGMVTLFGYGNIVWADALSWIG